MSDKPFPCKSCDEGDEPVLLDIDGVRCCVGGNAGCWAHAHEDDWWPCQRKAAEEHAMVQCLPDVVINLRRFVALCIIHGEETFLRGAELCLREVKAADEAASNPTHQDTPSGEERKKR